MLYGGWPVIGMFCMEVNRGNLVGLRAFSPLLALLMGNPGGTGFQKSGVIRKAYSKNGNSYELASLVVYSTNGSGAGLDSWPATSWLPQVTITWVPYEASANGVGALTPAFGPSFNTGLQSAADFGVQLPNAIRGGTLYFSMTKTTVDTVQSWIIGDLIESAEFTGSVNDHGSLPQNMNPPYVIDNSIGLVAGTDGVQQRLVTVPYARVPNYSQPLGYTLKYFDGGIGSISGVVKVNNVIYPNQVVVCFRARDHRIVGKTTSGPDGSYSFLDLDPSQKYYVVAHDGSGVYNGVIQDQITPLANVAVTVKYMRKAVTLSGVAGAGAGNTVRIKVGESSSAVGADFPVSCLTFPATAGVPGDIQWLDASGSSILDCWVEKVEGAAPNRVATFWVKIPGDLGTDYTLYATYRNFSARPCNGAATFLEFADFSADGVPASNLYLPLGNPSTSIYQQGGVLTLDASLSVNAKLAAFSRQYSDGYEVLCTPIIVPALSTKNNRRALAVGWGDTSLSQTVLALCNAASGLNNTTTSVLCAGTNPPEEAANDPYRFSPKIGNNPGLIQVGRASGMGYAKVAGALVMSRAIAVNVTTYAVFAQAGEQSMSVEWAAVRKFNLAEPVVIDVADEEAIS